MSKDRGIYEKAPGSGEWWIRWQDENKVIRRRKIGKSKADAKRAVEQMRARVRLAAIAPELVAEQPKKVTLKKAMDHVLETSKASPRHRMYEAVYADRFDREWPGAFLDDIKADAIDRWIAKRRSDGVKPSTILHQLSFLSKVLKTSFRARWIAENPCLLIERPVDKARKTRFFSEDEIGRLRDYLTFHYGILSWWVVELFILTGIRRSELFAIERDHVDLELGILILPATKGGKGGGVQYVQLSSDALSVIRQILSLHSLPWLFPGKRGKGPMHSQNFYNRIYKPALRELGITDATLHTTRHTHASHLAIRGASIQEIKEALRQKSTAVAERYTHLNDEARRQTAQRLSGITGRCE